MKYDHRVDVSLERLPRVTRQCALATFVLILDTLRNKHKYIIKKAYVFVEYFEARFSHGRKQT